METRKTLGFSIGGLSAVAVALAAQVSVAQQPGGTADEAKAMLLRAAAAIKAGETAALTALNDKGNRDFHDRDLYVACANWTDYKITAQPNPALLGTDLHILKVKDDPLGQRMIDTIQSVPEGTIATIDYNYPRPGTTDPVPKQAFVMHVGNQGCSVGHYK